MLSHGLILNPLVSMNPLHTKTCTKHVNIRPGFKNTGIHLLENPDFHSDPQSKIKAVKLLKQFCNS